MTRFKKPFRFIKKQFYHPFRWLRLFIKQQLGLLDVPKVILYRGYGNKQNVFVRGAVIEDRGLLKPRRTDSMWRNMKSMLSRYIGDVIPGAKVSVRFNGHQLEIESDENGHFGATFPGPGASNDFHPIVNAQLEEQFEGIPEKLIKSRGDIMLPGPHIEFGIISDIDDTIMISNATQTLKKIRLMLMKNAVTRKPFPGIAAFYQALHRGVSGQAQNPFFYVSSSEWNLYDLLDDFVEENHLPRGVFLLQDLNESILKFWKSGGGTHEHKLVKIRKILKTYSDLSFVLVGDSGQRDPEIYKKVVDEFPNRIKAVYIRHIPKGLKLRRLNGLLNDFKNHGVDMLLLKDTYDAAVHAVENKLIGYDWLRNVSEEKHKEEEYPGLFEGLIKYVEEVQRND
jgi:phosphatidate phosphatase APP1